jgi:hypothetical protein
MTRPELEQCIGYEVIVYSGPFTASHIHGVLLGFDAHGDVLVDFGMGGPPAACRREEVICLGLLQRRLQEARIAEAMPKLLIDTCPRCAVGTCSAHQPCTCGVWIGSCPVHCPAVKP